MTPSRVVYHAPHDVRIEAMPDMPVPAAGEVCVRIEACAICGSDVKTFLNGNPRIRPPRTMGHEFCGTIVETGSSVTRYRPGQRVTMATTMGCGECHLCRQGHPNLCPDLHAMGFHCDGAMAPYAIIPERGVSQGNLVDVGNLDPACAALGEPVSCVVSSLSRMRQFSPGAMLVIGLGPMGILHALLGRDFGMDPIIGVARPGLRHDAAKQLPLDAVITPHDMPSAITQWTAGRGFDGVVVTAPDADLQGTAPDLAAKRGAVSLFASLPKGSEMITLNSRTVHYGEQIVYGTSDSTVDDVREAVAWLGSHQALLKNFVTHRLPMEDFAIGLNAIMQREAIKVVLVNDEA